VRCEFTEGPSDEFTIENMLMFYEEIRDNLVTLGILTAEQVAEQQRLLGALKGPLPAVWGCYRVTAIA